MLLFFVYFLSRLQIDGDGPLLSTVDLVAKGRRELADYVHDGEHVRTRKRIDQEGEKYQEEEE